MILEQTVVDLIDVREVVDGLAIFVLVVEAGFIVKDGVEADVFEACDPPGFAKVVAVALAQGDDPAFRAEHFFPEMREGM